MARFGSHSDIQHDAAHGRLLARPGHMERRVEPGRPGLHRLGLGARRDGLRYVPPRYHPDEPAPLVLMLHGAGGNADEAIGPLLRFADTADLILLAPDSRGTTWDIVLGEYGPDVAFIEVALQQTFERFRIDPRHVAAEGFSDGASYALSLGLANGDLFTHVIAFSPGFMAPTERRGHPRIFITHGSRDPVLQVDRCSRNIVLRLEQLDYGVRYEEFSGGHAVPPALARQAVDWFTQEGAG